MSSLLQIAGLGKDFSGDGTQLPESGVQESPSWMTKTNQIASLTGNLASLNNDRGAAPAQMAQLPMSEPSAPSAPSGPGGYSPQPLDDGQYLQMLLKSMRY